MISYQDYKHSIPIQIRFSDIDKLGHVNNACYLNYFELGRVFYLNNLLVETNNWTEYGFVLARTELDYIDSILLPHKIYCCTKVIKIGTKSLVTKSVLIKEIENGYMECASANFTLVAMNYIENKSMAVPDKWRKLIEDFEK